jgi:hypothetical protein
LPFNLKSAIAPLKSYIVHRKSHILHDLFFFSRNPSIFSRFSAALIFGLHLFYQEKRWKKGMNHRYAFRLPVFVTGDDDTFPSGQGLSDGLEGLSSHQDRHGPGKVFKIFQVIGQVPGKLVIDTDYIGFIGGHQQGKLCCFHLV